MTVGLPSCVSAVASLCLILVSTTASSYLCMALQSQDGLVTLLVTEVATVASAAAAEAAAAAMIDCNTDHDTHFTWLGLMMTMMMSLSLILNSSTE